MREWEYTGPCPNRRQKPPWLLKQGNFNLKNYELVEGCLLPGGVKEKFMWSINTGANIICYLQVEWPMKELRMRRGVPQPIPEAMIQARAPQRWKVKPTSFRDISPEEASLSGTMIQGGSPDRGWNPQAAKVPTHPTRKAPPLVFLHGIPLHLSHCYYSFSKVCPRAPHPHRPFQKPHGYKFFNRAGLSPHSCILILSYCLEW